METFPENVSVLIIDDEDTVSGLIAKVVERMGAANVMIAKDGGDGLIIACREIPTLIICDISMSPVDGLSLLAGIRFSRNKTVSTIPVVMFTGLGDAAAESRATKLGVDGYYRKPFSPAGLSRVLAKAAKKRVEEGDDE